MTKFLSRLFNEVGEIAEDGTVTFASGVIYTRSEIDVLRISNPDDIKAIHSVRKIFAGDLEYCGKSTVVCVMPEVKKEAAATVDKNPEQLSLFK